MVERPDHRQTLLVRSGLDAHGTDSPLSPPIYQSTVYQFGSLDDLEAAFTEPSKRSVYYRNGTPNGRVLEELLSRLEGGEAAVCTASGMAAVYAALLAVLGPGDHLLADWRVYGGTYALLVHDLPKQGIEVSLVDLQDREAREQALRPTTRAVFAESLSNPLMNVLDLPELVAWSSPLGLAVVVDNSFATPALFRPLEWGAGLVVHSLPKYLSGHSSAMGGVVIGGAAQCQRVRDQVIRVGATLGPFDAWMALQGIRTLELRMQRHSQNALTLARWLSTHPAVQSVHYPLLPSHPQIELAKQLFPQGAGGMLALDLGSRGRVDRAVRKLVGRIPLAPSLADVATTLTYPAGTSHRALSPEQSAAQGIGDGLIRLSVGLEWVEDVARDLLAGLQ